MSTYPVSAPRRCQPASARCQTYEKRRHRLTTDNRETVREKETKERETRDEKREEARQMSRAQKEKRSEDIVSTGTSGQKAMKGSLQMALESAFSKENKDSNPTDK